MKLWILLISLVASSPAKIIKIINKERKIYNQDPIYYNYDLYEKIKKYETLGSWFYENGIYSYTIQRFNRTNRLKGSFLNQYINDTSFDYFFRDTYKNSVSKIFQFRVNQRRFFNPELCSKLNFDYWSSCVKNPKATLQNSKPRSWWYAYYLPMIQKDLKWIFCLKLNVEGRYIPDKLKGIQTNAFFCYSNPINQTSDYPF